MNHWEISSAKAVRDFANKDIEERRRRSMVENSTIEASTILKQTNLSIQELNLKQGLQIDHLFNLIELQRSEQEEQRKIVKESRFISWTVLVISLIGTIFTVISYFK